MTYQTTTIQDLDLTPTNESDARRSLAQLLEAAARGQDVEMDLINLQAHVGNWMMMDHESATWDLLFDAALEITSQ